MTTRNVIQGNNSPNSTSVQRAIALLSETPSQLRLLASDLEAGLSGGATDIKFDRPSRLLYATDASLYEMEPVAVVFPRTTADVQHALDVARKYRIPILCRGGGTSLAGQTVNHAIVLDFSLHMDKLLEINPEENWARVQPGIILTELNRISSKYGLTYPIDPSTANRATIGGGIGNNSCGTHSAIYGKTIDNVLSLEVLLSDGTRTIFEPKSGIELENKFAQTDFEGTLYRGLHKIAQQNQDEITTRFPTILRRVSGYNLNEFTNTECIDMSRIIVGSEGTLGIVTEAKVKLVALPAERALAAVHFRSVVEAADAVLSALEHKPAAVELIDDTIINRCRDSLNFSPLVTFVDGYPGALLLIELFADSPDDLNAKLQNLVDDFEKKAIGYSTYTTTDKSQQRNIWRMREAGLGILMSIKGDAKPVAFVEDTAVDPKFLATFVARFEKIIQSHNLTAGYYGHASVGCLHIRPLVNVKSNNGLKTMETIAEQIAELVLEFGGSLSGEHGDGIVRGAFTERMFGGQITQAFRDIKQLFDPGQTFNPGKIIDTPPFNDNLRLSPSTINSKEETILDFRADGGLAQAVELCNGQGTCRKFEGTMCPSYMVTRDEEHSTRGRANLLRQALNGVLPLSELSGERIHEALDLCVECKACKAECPSGVDMAKIKYEVLHKYHQSHGQSWQDRAFININAGSRFAGRIAPIANALARFPIVRIALNRILKIHPDRPLPKLARKNFQQWFRRHQQNTPKQHFASRGQIVFFDDTFTNYYHPEAGRAATEILEALGYDVVVLPQLSCCGRPAISRGMLNSARDWAEKNIRLLHPFAERGIPIVGIEPSCILTFRDEYPELLRSSAAASVATNVFLLDELLSQLATQEPEIIANCFRKADDRHVLLHAHCHQKALVGVQPTLDALKILGGYKVDLIESACCGMAGSFGFETAHYEVSHAMGNRTLFPAIAEAEDDSAIAITGVSCRQQIDHFTERKTQHVAELLAAALLKENEY